MILNIHSFWNNNLKKKNRGNDQTEIVFDKRMSRKRFFFHRFDIENKEIEGKQKLCDDDSEQNVWKKYSSDMCLTQHLMAGIIAINFRATCWNAVLVANKMIKFNHELFFAQTWTSELCFQNEFRKKISLYIDLGEHALTAQTHTPKMCVRDWIQFIINVYKSPMVEDFTSFKSKFLLNN